VYDKEEGVEKALKGWNGYLGLLEELYGSSKSRSEVLSTILTVLLELELPGEIKQRIEELQLDYRIRIVSTEECLERLDEILPLAYGVLKWEVLCTSASCEEKIHTSLSYQSERFLRTLTYEVSFTSFRLLTQGHLF